MKKWEYHVRGPGYIPTLLDLTLYGDEGWELVTITTDHFCIFKREKQEVRPESDDA